MSDVVVSKVVLVRDHPSHIILKCITPSRAYDKGGIAHHFIGAIPILSHISLVSNADLLVSKNSCLDHACLIALLRRHNWRMDTKQCSTRQQTTRENCVTLISVN